MPTGVGVFQLPIPIVLGADKPTGTFTLPMFSVEGVGGASAPAFEIPTLVIEGTGSAPESTVVFHVPIISVMGQGYAGVLGTGTFHVPILLITAGYGFRGSGTFVLPKFVFGNSVPLHGVGSFSVPIPIYAGFGSLVPISKIYRGIVININNQAISTYSGFNFNSLAYFNDHYYGANENGIFKLGGNKDNLTRQILSKLKTGAINFGDGSLKYIRQAWLTYRTDGHLQITFLVDEDEDSTSVSQTEIVADNIREEMLKCGRGLKGRFYTIVLENLSGADFDIEQLSVLVDPSSRRVR
jgi:hypothetical protein